LKIIPGGRGEVEKGKKVRDQEEEKGEKEEVYFSNLFFEKRGRRQKNIPRLANRRREKGKEFSDTGKVFPPAKEKGKEKKRGDEITPAHGEKGERRKRKEKERISPSSAIFGAKKKREEEERGERRLSETLDITRRREEKERRQPIRREKRKWSFLPFLLRRKRGEGKKGRSKPLYSP